MTSIYTTSEATNTTALTFSASKTPGGFIGDATSLTLNNPSYVVITSSSNQLTTSQFLPPTMGGFGSNPLSSTGVITSNGSALVNVPFAATAVVNSIAQRDSNGNLVANVLTSVGATISNNIQVPIVNVVPSNTTLAKTIISERYIQTTNATATVLGTISTNTSALRGAYLIICEITLADVTGGVNTGAYAFLFKVKNISGTVTISPVSNTLSILDGTLTNTSYTINTSGTDIQLLVTGLANTTISWAVFIRSTQTTF